MIKKIDLNKQGLKAFFYNFFIIWNLLIIILLIFLNIYFSSDKIKKVDAKKEIPQEWGQFKIKWKSNSKYQRIGTKVFSIATEAMNSDKIRDIVTLSLDGILASLNGKNGYTLFKVNLPISPCTHIKIIPKPFRRILIGSTNGNIICISSSGKKIWELKGVSKVFSIGVARKNKEFNILANFSVDLRFINLLKGKFEQYINSFKNPLFSEILTYDFNNDKNDDAIVGDTESIYCIDGLTGNILWRKKLKYLYAGKFSIITDNNSDIFLLVPLYNGKIIVLNKSGIDVWEYEINERLVNAPVVFKNKKNQYCFVQSTIQGSIICFNFEKRKKLWVREALSSSSVKMGMCDFNYDDVPEIVTIDKYGKLSIIRSDNGNIIDTLSVLENPQFENIISNIVIDDIDNDGNFEIVIASDKGNVYVYTYVVVTKHKFWKILLNKKRRWNLYGGNINGNFKFN